MFTLCICAFGMHDVLLGHLTAVNRYEFGILIGLQDRDVNFERTYDFGEGDHQRQSKMVEAHRGNIIICFYLISFGRWALLT